MEASNDRLATSLRFRQGQLSILDQRLLPQQERWHDCADADELIAHIHSLAVRGAPLIGLSAALMLAQSALRGQDRTGLLAELERLRAARPTAVNLMNYMDRMRSLIHAGANAQELLRGALAIFDEDRALCARLASHGLTQVPQGSRILTHCNTGSLATAGIGTAIGVITHAHAQDRRIEVFVDETRPLLQGARLSCWELARAGVPYQLICDNMAASLMLEGRIDLVLVGADRIAANGDTANKVGTYGLAVLARHHQIPFFVVAPQTSIDLECPDASAIPIEQRSADEVRGVATAQGQMIWSPDDAPVCNPAFDVTPSELISGWILDNGCWTDFATYRAAC